MNRIIGGVQLHCFALQKLAVAIPSPFLTALPALQDRARIVSD
jgi:hypothetical protein